MHVMLEAPLTACVSSDMSNGNDHLAQDAHQIKTRVCARLGLIRVPVSGSLCFFPCWVVISRNCFLGLGPPQSGSQRTSCMDPAPAFSARGQRGGWTQLYYEAFDKLTRWAWREFKVGVTRVAWEEASDLHRSSLLAWQADFPDNAYRHLRDIYPDLYDAVIARGRHQSIPILQRAQAAAQGAAGQPPAPVPAQPQQQPSTPSSPSSTTTVSTIKAAATSAAPTQVAAGPGDQAAAPSAAVPTRTSSESPSRPSSFPPVKAGRRRYTAAGRSSSRRKRTPPTRRQPSPPPVRKASTRRPQSRTPLRAATQAQRVIGAK